MFAALLATACLSTFTACGSSSDDVESVVLDQPGEYQEPGIALNRDLDGDALEITTLLDRDDIETDITDFFGQPLVINFWFTACPPCKREMPALQSVHETYADRVRFIGINSVDTRERMVDFADDMGVTYQLLRDPDSEFLVSNGIAAFPTTLFVAADGTVVEQISGELTVDVLTATIEAMLA